MFLLQVFPCRWRAGLDYKLCMRQAAQQRIAVAGVAATASKPAAANSNDAYLPSAIHRTHTAKQNSPSLLSILTHPKRNTSLSNENLTHNMQV